MFAILTQAPDPSGGTNRFGLPRQRPVWCSSMPEVVTHEDGTSEVTCSWSPDVADAFPFESGAEAGEWASALGCPGGDTWVGAEPPLPEAPPAEDPVAAFLTKRAARAERETQAAEVRAKEEEAARLKKAVYEAEQADERARDEALLLAGIADETGKAGRERRRAERLAAVEASVQKELEKLEAIAAEQP